MLEYVPSLCRKVLDVGCGTGSVGASIRKRTGCEVWGVESNAGSIQQAEQNIDKVFHGYFGPELDLPLGYFDCIVFNDVLEQMLDQIPRHGVLPRVRAAEPQNRAIDQIPQFVVANSHFLMNKSRSPMAFLGWQLARLLQAGRFRQSGMPHPRHLGRQLPLRCFALSPSQRTFHGSRRKALRPCTRNVGLQTVQGGTKNVFL